MSETNISKKIITYDAIERYHDNLEQHISNDYLKKTDYKEPLKMLDSNSVFLINRNISQNSVTGPYNKIFGYSGANFDDLSISGDIGEYWYNNGKTFSFVNGFNNTINGINNIILGIANSHAEGAANAVFGTVSHAEGQDNTVTGSSSHAEGAANIAFGNYSHAEGKGQIIPFNELTQLSNTNIKSVWQEHSINIAFGEISHVEGCSNVAFGVGSHAEGYYTYASGAYSHAEGNYTETHGDYAHAEGYGTHAFGRHSHAEGYVTSASGAYSHAGGYGTEASWTGESAVGRYNKSAGIVFNKSTIGVPLFSIGCGGNTGSTIIRKNAIEVATTGISDGTAGDALIYIYGIGNYDGTNPSSNNDFRTIFNNTQTSITNIETSLSTMATKTELQDAITTSITNVLNTPV